MDKIESEKINFWIETWESLIINFLKKSYGLSLYSPHTIIEDIIIEIEENNFKNNDNKKFLYAKLDYFFKNDPIIIDNFFASFKILRQLYNSDQTKYLLETAKTINRKFEKGSYFDAALISLIELLNNKENIDIQFSERISHLSQNLIIELIRKGYDLEDIKSFASNIFDWFKPYENDGIEYINTKYPHGINPDSYLIENIFQQKKFNEAIAEVISNLTLELRIRALSKYYYKQKTKAHYIFIVEGIKGSIDVELAGITFYSLDKKKFITDNSNIDQEDLQSTLNDDERFIQAAVEVDFLLPKSSLAKAISKLQNALDILACYFKTETALEINISNYVIVQNGHYRFSSWGRDKRDSFVKYHSSLDLNSLVNYLENINENSFLWDDSKRNAKIKILNALHWFSKAEMSNKQEDKLLNYWISIENLLNVDYNIISPANKSKIGLAKEIISSVQMFPFIFDYGWELYNYYSNRALNSWNNVKLPKELIEKANLRPEIGDQIKLEDFIECIKEFKKIETNIFILNKLDDLEKFYEDKSFLKIKVIEQTKVIKDDIQMIYRFRNLIVHNAHFNNTLLPYFVWKVRIYSQNLIRNLITSAKETNNELPDLFIGFHLKQQEFYSDLDKGTFKIFKE